ncbi:hypothetical protein MAR_005859 [Mya arenaria]|uniref:Uncharacterized protein n=1 Tax=Mya arenaria TaxID=6604 RepID=A0ABY7F4L8_MYAAR|nr:hypothetical protein MAR_005859 [Mya arenaria]
MPQIRRIGHQIPTGSQRPSPVKEKEYADGVC